MVFLFSLINISFTLFFFLFWQYIESILFWILSIIFIIFFSKILSFFIEKNDISHKETVIHDKKIKKFPIKIIIEYFKKWSYYIAFLFFYLSLYGFIYSINRIYNFSNFIEIFHYITFFISLVIVSIFFFFLQKKQETIFLIFRSNCIVFTLIYSIFLLFFLSKNISPSIFFVINSIFPIITLSSVLVFDSFFKEKKKYIYSLFLFYLFIIAGYYISTVFSTIPPWYIFLLILSFFMSIYTFIFPSIRIFNQFKHISRIVGIFMGYILSLSIIFSILIESFSLFYVCMAIISMIYQYSIYRFFKNYISYVVFLLTFVFLYVKIFFIFWINSLASSLVFIFLLPSIFVGVSYFIQNKYPKEIYILHFIGIGLGSLALIYCLIQIGFIRDTLSLSIILFFESILLFASYLRFKK
ncbi:MAG: hypothetical protein ACD_71C00229G0002 [uncultured bacterium (gcode 4)]|uniref:Uncharacterized protein n=1 Tax=uncultured bacterium (gcode 4) TaxID=1234023 RepID=K1YME0_9BACT|nr:MAG: hypothetical protein ACD_71C00229G0002 [uncultured bacterium (gcode 4)]